LLFISSPSNSNSNNSNNAPLYLWIFLRELSRYGSTLIVEYFVLNQDQHILAKNYREDFSMDAFNANNILVGPFWIWEYVGYDDGESIKSIEESITVQINKDAKSILYLGGGGEQESEGNLEMLFGSYCYDKNKIFQQLQSRDDIATNNNRIHNILNLLGISHK